MLRGQAEKNPALRGRPVIVVRMLTDSAVAIAAIYAAKAFGLGSNTGVTSVKLVEIRDWG